MTNENKNTLVEFPELYKKASKGALQFWKIEVHPCAGTGEDIPSEIVTTYGQVGTDSPQTTFDVIEEGKNLGKANATTAHQQAVAEAKAKWEKQKKKGYVESLMAADAGELDELIEGGKEPMLAHSHLDVIYDVRPGHENDPPRLEFTKDAQKIKFPAYVQPKLDGIRGVNVADDDSRKMWSRTRKRINSVPHIVEEMQALLGQDQEKDGDGELYNHDFKNDFEKIVSAVRSDEPEEGHLNVQYHLYDMIMEGDFATRIEHLANLVHSYEKIHGPLKYVRLVPTVLVNSREELMEVFEKYCAMGYEGAMVRNAKSKYVNKRSYDLQKLKKFMEDDFEIVGIKEGRGKLSGHVGAFVLKLKDVNGTVDVKLEGDTDYLKTCFEDESQWKGKKMTVVFQGFTAEKSLRFPVGKAIRNYE